jgi:hypothetical protein
VTTQFALEPDDPADHRRDDHLHRQIEVRPHDRCLPRNVHRNSGYDRFRYSEPRVGLHRRARLNPRASRPGTLNSCFDVCNVVERRRHESRPYVALSRFAFSAERFPHLLDVLVDRVRESAQRCEHMGRRMLLDRALDNSVSVGRKDAAAEMATKLAALHDRVVIQTFGSSHSASAPPDLPDA